MKHPAFWQIQSEISLMLSGPATESRSIHKVLINIHPVLNSFLQKKRKFLMPQNNNQKKHLKKIFILILKGSPFTILGRKPRLQLFTATWRSHRRRSRSQGKKADGFLQLLLHFCCEIAGKTLSKSINN